MTIYVVSACIYITFIALISLVMRWDRDARREIDEANAIRRNP